MYDVAIIGYGPVGATLANLLGQAGWQIALIEATTEIPPVPRAVHCDDEAQRIWQAAGVLDLLRSGFGGYPPDRQYINAKGKVYFETYLNTTNPFGYQSNMYFHQPTLEAGLREGVARFVNVTCFLGATAINLQQDHQSVTLQLKNEETSTTETLQARYVVGCDGARSFVRKSLNIRLHDLKFEQPWLVTDFYLKPGLTREDVGFPYAHQQICDPAQPISFIPNGVKGHYRFEFMLPSGVTKEEAEQEAYVHKMLAGVVDLDKIDIVRGTVYTFHSLIAKQWRDRRILIAGDAAHQMPPFAGQGMCSGLRDAHNLSWKLRLVLAGQAQDELLDSYEIERKPHVTRMTKGSVFLGNLVQTRNPLRALLRDFLFQTIFRIPALFGRISRFALRSPGLQTKLRGGSNSSVIGTYFIQPEVTDGTGGVQLLDELLGSGFAVLGLGHDPASHFASFKGRLPISCFLVVPASSGGDANSIIDHTGKLAGWFAENEAEFVIIRPDRFVFGAYTVANISQAESELATQLALNIN